MKFNISYPLTGAQKLLEIDDEKKFSIFYDKRIGQEVEADQLGEDFKGYIFKVTGGNDKDGFTMKQGVLVKGRVRLLMRPGMSCFRPRREGHKKRKSIRGCIIGQDIAVLSLSVVKKGEKEIPGLTDAQHPRRLGPKRASKIRKLFGLKKDQKSKDNDDTLIKANVIRRKYQDAKGKERQKAPKIQRLITEERLRRKRILKTNKRKRWDESKKLLSEYQKQLQEFHKEQQKKYQQKKEQAEKKKQEKAAATTGATTTTTAATQQKKQPEKQPQQQKATAAVAQTKAQDTKKQAKKETKPQQQQQQKKK